MSSKEVRLIDVELLKERINRQIKYCHGYVGNKKAVYKEALLAVKSIIHELEQKNGGIAMPEKEVRLIDANVIKLLEDLKCEYYPEPNGYAWYIADDVWDCINEAPTIDLESLESNKNTIPLDEVYRVIAGHSDYHGDNILAALTCIAEGKDVKPVRPLDDLRPHGKWERVVGDIHRSGYAVWCTNCGKYHFVHYRDSLGGLYGHDELFREPPDCPNCGAIMEVGNV